MIPRKMRVDSVDSKVDSVLSCEELNQKIVGLPKAEIGMNVDRM